ncbi:MAG: hypothetical protein WCJ64_23160 [Rhodospirillaceae bacterium]
MAPAEQPGDQEHDDMEAAEAHGLRVGLWEAACIARRGLAEGQGAGDAAGAESYADLTGSERENLRALNRVLAEVERRFHPAAVETTRRLQARKRDRTDCLSDFEVFLTIDLYPADGDPSWSEDSDNQIGSVVERLTDVKALPEFGFGALGTNHAVPGLFPGERHCWLFHSACCHSGLGWGDLLRVGLVWADFSTIEQTVMPVARP